MKAGLFALQETSGLPRMSPVISRYDPKRLSRPRRGCADGFAAIAYVCRPQVALKAQLFLIAGLTTPVGTISKIMTLSRTDRLRLRGAK